MHLLLLSSLARAQDAGFDAHGFGLAALEPDRRDPLTVERPGAMDAGQFYVGGLFEYASQPLVRADQAADGAISYTPLLDNVFALNLSAGYAPLDRLRVGVAAPLYLASAGEEGPQGAGVGDVRLSAMGLLVSPSGGGLGLGVVPWLDLPTGDAARFLGQPGLSGGAKLAGTAEVGAWTVGGDLGYRINPASTLGNLQNADQISVGLAGGWSPSERWGLTLEATARLPVTANEVVATEVPAELILSGRRTAGGIQLVAGGAAAVVRGASAAQYRLFLGGGWGHAPEARPVVVDQDGDGLVDSADACPAQAEVVNTYRDEDGCPDALASLEVRVLRGGSPVSGAEVSAAGLAPQPSGDGPIRYADLAPGSAYEVVARKGDCLAGAGAVTLVEGVNRLEIGLRPTHDAAVRVEVVGPDDKPVPGAEARWEQGRPACTPDEPLALGSDGAGRQQVGAGAHTLLVSAPGFAATTVAVDLRPGEEEVVRVKLQPTKLKVQDQEILILETVYFDSASATIQARSNPLLDEVAATLRQHPEILLLEIQGHTDADGPEDYNRDLSQRRVEAVRDYLVAKGVAADRLSPKGYGESQPIADNATPEGKAQNRRVAFKILKREPAPAPAGQ